MELEVNQISGSIVNAAMSVHSELGPGLLEEAYKMCLAAELSSRGLHVLVEVALPVVYKSIHIDIGYRLDLLINDAVVVELKAVQQLAPIHKAQLLSYLKLSKKNLGLLINFNSLQPKDGIIRMVNNLHAAPLGVPLCPPQKFS